MLYDKLRYVDVIFKLYQLSHLLARKKHPDLAPRMGYARYSRHYYKIRDRMKREGVIDGNGRWIDTPTNRWILSLPSIEKPEIARILGYESAYKIYLALMFMDSTPTELSEELGIKKPTVHAVLKRILEHSLIEREGRIVSTNKRTGMYRWMSRYIEACYTESHVKNDDAILFDCVPGYIDGAQAYHLTHYQAGLPMGCADIIIRSSRMYDRFWRTALDKTRHYAEYPQKIRIMRPEQGAKIVMHRGTPVNKNSRKWWQ